MPQRIRIYTKSASYVSAEVSLEKNAKTAKAILNALPIRGVVNRWGDEIYFNIPVIEKEENAQEEVNAGDLGYWPTGHGFCIFFGRTPASTGDKPRAASPVNVFGRVFGDATVFRNTKSGEEIIIEKDS
ncbi:MAG: cyclophilin-like fold protein [Candidatus Bathyarchaeota archaeon]